MTITPNQMPKKPSPSNTQLITALIETRPSSWIRKVLTKDEDGKEKLDTVKVNHAELRFPLAGNVSDANVERAAKRFL